MAKYIAGVGISFLFGVVTRKLQVPSMAPMTYYGCLLVAAMTSGYFIGGKF